jgi:ribonuclease P protein component
MKQAFRLRQAADFERLRREGHTYRQPFIILSLAANTLGHNRYGFITGRRIGNAVVRNRVRRRLREVVRQQHPQLAPGFDIVIIARPLIVDQTYTAIQLALSQTFDRAGLLVNKDKPHP